MENHRLVVDAATKPGHIDFFLESVPRLNNASGNLHLRAYEAMHTAKDGTSSRVTILFVRSGRETPFEWLRNMWNRKSQYALAAKVLRDQGGFTTDVMDRKVDPGISRPNYRAMSGKDRETENEKLITVSSLRGEAYRTKTNISLKASGSYVHVKGLRLN